MTTFSLYLLHLMTSNNSLIHHQNFLSLNFVTKNKKYRIWDLFIQSQQWKCQNNVWNMFKINNNKDVSTRSLTSCVSIVGFEQLITGCILSGSSQEPGSRKYLEILHAWLFERLSTTHKFLNGGHWNLPELKQFVIQTTKTQ